MNTKKFTILHNNDIHGDFLSEVKSGKEGKLIGGLALLSGYINKVRKEEENTKFYKICIQNYHFSNSLSYLNISQEELLESKKQKVVTTSAQQVLEEWFRNHQNETRKIEGRINYIK